MNVYHLAVCVLYTNHILKSFLSRKIVPDKIESKTMALMQAAHAIRNEKVEIRRAASHARQVFLSTVVCGLSW